MKKLLATVLSVLACGAAYALPCGNPADPAIYKTGLFWENCNDYYYDDCCGDPCYDPCGWDWDISFRIGYYGDFVFNRDLRFDEFNDGRVDRTKLWTNGGLLVLNFWERLDVYAMLGGTRVLVESNALDFGVIAFGRTKIETDTHFSWSVGAKAVLWECGCTYIGLDARYFRAHPDVRRIVLNDTLTLNPDDLELRYREWQVNLGIAYRINMFVPYFAVKWSKVDLDFNGTTIIPIGTVTAFTASSMEADQHWGYAVGVSLVDWEMATLNVEARFRDEKAIAVNAQIRL